MKNLLNFLLTSITNYERIVIFSNHFGDLFADKMKINHASNNYTLECEIRFTDELHKEVRENGLSDEAYDELVNLHQGFVSLNKVTNIDLPEEYSTGDKIKLNGANRTIIRTNDLWALKRLESFTSDVIITSATLQFGTFEEYNTDRFH